MKTLKHFAILICIALINTANAQFKKPSDYFSNKRIKVLVLGTFHFDYPNLDALKTQDSDKIDVLSSQKAKEMTEIVDKIKKFKPTKIAIEAFPDWNANKKLNEYKKGMHRKERDERYQLGMRIASELNLPEIYNVDASSILNELDVQFGRKDPLYFAKKKKDYDFTSNDEISKRYEEFYKTSEPKDASLLSILKYLNSPDYHRYEYGSYLVGDFKLRETDGADMLSLYWYNRNLRIFRNIQNITNNDNERILVIVGNGHASVLRQLFSSSPEYDLMEVSRFLK